MLRTVFSRSGRLATPVQRFQSRMYTDKFQERENASENMYIHAKTKEQLDEIENHIKQRENDAKK
ncbi:hypothetical protein IWW50_000700 [Coemansia erecta]|nr:hypothetical protein IWW50_000700 [Coemansia erecta]